MPRVETRGSENEEEIAGYRNHFNSWEQWAIVTSQ